MYHELELPGRVLCRNDPGYVRYVVTAADFRAQIAVLARHGFRGLNVSEALTGDSSPTPIKSGTRLVTATAASNAGYGNPAAFAPAVVFTFDDGCETDLLTAAPLLQERAWNATCFLVTGRLGQRGYLTKEQARTLADLRFEVGCHSMTHADLVHLGPAVLRSEIVDAKDRLEQIIGRAVNHFSCPGGRWSPEVARLARKAGYRSVSTSRIGVNAPQSDPYCLNRVPILRDESNLVEICQGRGLGVLRLRQLARSAVRSVMGDSVYERLRGGLLR
jgi:peptidoglycan/xylan/chitin deacetylase (PgdA/CDA1 family)